MECVVFGTTRYRFVRDARGANHSWYACTAQPRCSSNSVGASNSRLVSVPPACLIKTDWNMSLARILKIIGVCVQSNCATTGVGSCESARSSRSRLQRCQMQESSSWQFRIFLPDNSSLFRSSVLDQARRVQQRLSRYWNFTISKISVAWFMDLPYYKNQFDQYCSTVVHTTVPLNWFLWEDRSMNHATEIYWNFTNSEISVAWKSLVSLLAWLSFDSSALRSPAKALFLWFPSMYLLYI